MEATIYVNTTSLVARSALTGIQVPPVTARLQAHLKLTIVFFEPDEEPALLAGATFRVALKSLATPTGSVFALLSAPTATNADSYEFEWDSIDAAALRTALGDSPDLAAKLEIEWTIDDLIERVAIPVTIQNAWLRSADSAPDPAADESDAWLIAQLASRITAGGYMRFVNSTGDVFHIGLNSGEPPG